ncbi:unnamed protein product [Rotaria sordida]|uniref:Uncharacterized protein n=1 Tax=Rotaria sordida TaxID=392033 RepID=A0A820D1W5_9BILA|nr:unnamed protein product [Rotaria sordida]
MSAAAVDLLQSTQNVTQRNINNMEATIKRKNDKFKNNLFIHVTHEARLKGLAREIHMIHDSHFKNTDYGEIRLVVGFRNNPNIEFELSRKRPLSSVLKDPLRKITIDPSVHFQNLSTTQELPKKTISNPMDMATSSNPTLLLPNYSKLSDSKFTQMLLTSMSNTINQDAIIELLNQKEILLFIREFTQLVNKFNYSKLQHEQWSYYYNLGMTEGIWNRRVSKKMAEANSMCYTYGRSKNLIKQRLAKYKRQCDKNQEAINQCMKQAPLIIDIQNITTMINDLINKDQYELRLELEKRKTMLRLDAEEHKLAQHFYLLTPRQTEINSAKVIWKAINEQQNIIHEIAIFKKWLQVHTQASSFSLQHIQLPNIYHMVTSLFFQAETSSADHIAQKTIARAEEIEQYYTNLVIIEKNKLQSTRSQHKNVQQLDEIINAILQRQNNMQQRRSYELQGKLINIFKQNAFTPVDLEHTMQHD